MRTSGVIAPAAEVPEPFQQALASMRAALSAAAERPELVVEDMPAPQRLAPHAAALTATVARDEVELAIGRLILLYDPEGQRGWDGGFRIVAYARAELEPEIAADSLIGKVGWSWLIEALDQRAAGYAAPSGTITRAVTESFGDKRDDPTTTELELRASWSPTSEDVSRHVAAWCDVLCLAAGLPPTGVSALPRSSSH